MNNIRRMSAGSLYSLEDFKTIKQIGEGTYATVFLVQMSDERKMLGDEELILKKIPKARSQPYFIYAEKEAGRRLRHPNLVKTRCFFEDTENFYIVQQFVPGKDLYKFFEERQFQPLTEKRAKTLFRQLAEAISFSNKSGVSHRDLKLENLILSDEGNDRPKLSC